MSSVLRITGRLVDKLWLEFEGETEMIINKRGRNMFPRLEFILEGLDPNGVYAISVKLERYDKNRYKFDHGKWNIFAPGEPVTEAKEYCHPEGSKTGAEWMRTPLTFSRLKLTNNPDALENSQMILHSMHRYQPVITIYRIYHNEGFESNSTTHHEVEAVIKDEATRFFAVTAYQNNQVTKLKVNNNKYAKGFRTKGENGEKAERKTSVKRKATASPLDGMQPANKKVGVYNPYILENQQQMLPPMIQPQNPPVEVVYEYSPAGSVSPPQMIDGQQVQIIQMDPNNPYQGQQPQVIYQYSPVASVSPQTSSEGSSSSSPQYATENGQVTMEPVNGQHGPTDMAKLQQRQLELAYGIQYGMQFGMPMNYQYYDPSRL